MEEIDDAQGPSSGWIPRTVAQARSLDEVLEGGMERSIDKVILVDVDEEELILRLSGRRICRDCEDGYHIKFLPPQVRNVCDQCGGRALSAR